MIDGHGGDAAAVVLLDVVVRWWACRRSRWAGRRRQHKPSSAPVSAAAATVAATSVWDRNEVEGEEDALSVIVAADVAATAVSGVAMAAAGNTGVHCGRESSSERGTDLDEGTIERQC